MRLSTRYYIFIVNFAYIFGEEMSLKWKTTDQNDFNPTIETFLDTHEISYFEGVELETPHYYNYDITFAVRAWKSGLFDQSNSILFKAAADHEADPTHNYKTFASFNRANHKPYLVVIYNTDNDSPPLANVGSVSSHRRKHGANIPFLVQNRYRRMVK